MTTPDSGKRVLQDSLWGVIEGECIRNLNKKMVHLMTLARESSPLDSPLTPPLDSGLVFSAGTNPFLSYFYNREGYWKKALLVPLIGQVANSCRWTYRYEKKAIIIAFCCNIIRFPDNSNHELGQESGVQLFHHLSCVMGKSVLRSSSLSYQRRIGAGRAPSTVDH